MSPHGQSADAGRELRHASSHHALASCAAGRDGQLLEHRTGADLALGVGEVGVALGRRVHLRDLRDAEAAHKRRPHLGAQPVAKRDAHLVRAIVRRWRRVDEVAAELTNVLHYGRIVLLTVPPEARRRELAREHALVCCMSPSLHPQVTAPH